MIFQFLRSRGLQDADAADLFQEVLRRVNNSIGRLDYEKQKGGFRAWLFTITRNCLKTHFEKQQRIAPTANNTTQLKMLSQLPIESDKLSKKWELEFQRQLMGKAIENLKPTIEAKTWRAFELTAIKILPANQVGESLSMSRGAVYVARSRVTQKLQQEVKRLMEEMQ